VKSHYSSNRHANPIGSTVSAKTNKACYVDSKEEQEEGEEEGGNAISD
jgi:hypothetical protein